MENKELPAEMLTAVTHEILRQKVMGFVDAQEVLEVAGVSGLRSEIERLRGSIAVEKKWRKDADDRAEEARAEIERLRATLADAPRLIAEQNARLARERDKALRAAALHRDMDHFNHALLEKARAENAELRAALTGCEDALDDIINCMGGDECSGWDAPEDVWELAQKGRTIARRVLGKEATNDRTN